MTAVVLTDPGHERSTLELTGPQAVTMAETAAALSSALGRPIRYESETVEQAYASRANYGAAPYEVDGWVSTYLAIANGELSTVTETVQEVTKHPPVGLLDHLKASR